MGSWRHKKRAKNDNAPDPTESAFFSNEAVGSISTALMREGNQNALDEVKDHARNIGAPVKIRITHSGKKYAIEPATAKGLLADLLPHLTAERNGIIPSDLPDFEQAMPYLIFEDFNTKGLEGDPTECRFDVVNDRATPNSFFYFWRAYGRSGKLANKMGSWGVGKSVFPAVSRLNCFWALTIRESDKEAYLIGQSVLKTHNRKDNHADYGYSPWGYYGCFDEEEFALPERSFEVIDTFKKTFNIKRDISVSKENRENNTGLSIIVPFPKEEVNAESLAVATIRQFFYPIMKGRLEVEIQYEDHLINLTKNTLQSEVERLDFSKLTEKELEETDKTKLLSLFDFSHWILQLKDEDFIKLTTDSPARAYTWGKGLFQGYDLAELQKKFDESVPLAFLVPVKYQPEGSHPEIKYFEAFIQKDLSMLEPESIFIRDALTITGVKSLKRKGARGIVIISDKYLVTFLGQAEGPAHTGWHKDNFRVKFENTEEVLSFVQRSLDRLYSLLQSPNEGVNKTLLSDLFFVNMIANDPVSGKGKKGKMKKSEDSKFVPPPPREQKFFIDQLESERGFRVYGNPTSEQLPETLKIVVAYDRLDANPFKKYSKFDFNVKKMKVSMTSVENVVLENNVIELSPMEKDFEFIMTGFDRNRDLIINVH